MIGDALLNINNGSEHDIPTGGTLNRAEVFVVYFTYTMYKSNTCLHRNMICALMRFRKQFFFMFYCTFCESVRLTVTPFPLI